MNTVSHKYRQSALLLLTAAIWGSAFVAQSVGMDYVEPFTYLFSRNVIGGIILIPIMKFVDKLNVKENNPSAEPKDKRTLIIGGICCGLALTAGSLFQQYGLTMTTVGKGGFITTLYIIITPIITVTMSKMMYAGENQMIVEDALGRIDTILNMKSLDELENKEEPKDSSIAFRDVTFQYEGAKSQAVNHVNLSIKPGEHVAFVGPSGGGKTTLASLVPRFFDVTGGTLENDYSRPDLYDEDVRATMSSTTTVKTYYTLPNGSGVTATSKTSSTTTKKTTQTTTTTTAFKADALYKMSDSMKYSSNVKYKVTSDTTYLNLRFGPSKSYDVQLKIPDGETIYGRGETTDSSGNVWVYTDYNGTAGWVMRELLS